MAQSQKLKDFQMLTGLGHDRIVGRHHQDGQIDPGRPGEHILDKALVARHIDDAQPKLPEVERGEANINRDAAGFLLRQAVAVDARQGFHQRGFAVVDVPGGAQNQVTRHYSSP